VADEERTALFRMVDLLLRVNLTLSSRIVTYSARIMAEHNLDKYRDKISLAQEHFLDFSRFKVQRPVSQRENLVAYIGRLSEGKGILNLIEAFPEILNKRSDIGFLIGGDGPLRGRVEICLNEANMAGRVNFVGWIPHDELPGYLNRVKLLVLPSYTEALPNIMLEAMACGTPVLVTAVGAIPDIIKDGETGFIMEDNSHNSIVRNIIRALEHPALEQIVRNACALIEREYTFEAAVARYGEILTGLD
jgi:glycosyltransferase involved in cell wall biosynthesis